MENSIQLPGLSIEDTYRIIPPRTILLENSIQLPGLSIEDTYRIIPPRTILLGYMGSIAHGTYIPNTDLNSIDDKDIMGVCVGAKESYLGLNRDKFEQKIVQEGVWDSVVYEARKFFGLLLKQNPNVLGLLWLRPEDYIYVSSSGIRIIANRWLFVSKSAYYSFVNYAKSQMDKMTCGAYQGYMGQKRKTIVDKIGFDCRNASHLIRLLRTGIEYLNTGTLSVFRKDAEELKQIKMGQWSLELVKEEAARLVAEAEIAYEQSSLPPQPDFEGAEKLLVSILEKELGYMVGI